jgi:hypothetical protein
MVLALMAAPLCAAPGVVPAGLDLWRTPGDGSTYTDFAKNPLPAGFFCDESQPFFGRIVFEGVPLTTEKRGGLGRTDTIVQRLDDARFNARGVATTRVQVKALSFASVSPVRTECGLYNVMASLDGPQPVTRMRIVRTGANGGYFIAPVSLAVKLTFTPVAGPARETREVVQVVEFDQNPRYAWTDEAVARPRQGKVRVDTDGDLEPDTVLRLGGRLATPTKIAAPTCHCNSQLASLSLDKALAPVEPAPICQHLHCPLPQ